jgi:hypothetical protein
MKQDQSTLPETPTPILVLKRAGPGAIATSSERAGNTRVRRQSDLAKQYDVDRPMIAPARYVLLSLASVITGYTVKAMERKIERGEWPEGRVWKRAPDGHIMVDVFGYQKWVEGQR